MGQSYLLLQEVRLKPSKSFKRVLYLLRTDKERTTLGTRYGLRFTTNPLLDLDIDLHRYILYRGYFNHAVETITLLVSCRSTPFEALHTVLLGPYKYLLRQLMLRLTSKQRSEVQAVVSAFNFSGFSVKINTSLCNHFRSFVGRDFKALAQCALFIFRNYFTSEEKRVWLALSKVAIHNNCSASFILKVLLSKWLIVNIFVGR